MGQTIVGLFRDSSDADVAAAYLRDEHTLTSASDLDVIGQAEWDDLSHPAADEIDVWIRASLTGISLDDAPGGTESVGKRWGDKVWAGETLVVARTFDRDIAEAIARDMQRTGAERVDMIPN